MLQRAAPAHAEMRADRRDALQTRRLDAQQVPPVRMAGPVIDFHGFARQRVGHIERPHIRQRDAVTAVAEVVDGQALNQGQLR